MEDSKQQSWVEWSSGAAFKFKQETNSRYLSKTDEDMIFSPELYEAVVHLVEGLLQRGEEVTTEACDALGVSVSAVTSIYQQAFVKRQKALTPVIEAQLEDIIKVFIICLFRFSPIAWHVLTSI